MTSETKIPYKKNKKNEKIISRNWKRCCFAFLLCCILYIAPVITLCMTYSFDNVSPIIDISILFQLFTICFFLITGKQTRRNKYPFLQVLNVLYYASCLFMVLFMLNNIPREIVLVCILCLCIPLFPLFLFLTMEKQEKGEKRPYDFKNTFKYASYTFFYIIATIVIIHGVLTQFTKNDPHYSLFILMPFLLIFLFMFIKGTFTHQNIQNTMSVLSGETKPLHSALYGVSLTFVFIATLALFEYWLRWGNFEGQEMRNGHGVDFYEPRPFLYVIFFVSFCFLSAFLYCIVI